LQSSRRIHLSGEIFKEINATLSIKKSGFYFWQRILFKDFFSFFFFNLHFSSFSSRDSSLSSASRLCLTIKK